MAVAGPSPNSLLLSAPCCQALQSVEQIEKVHYVECSFPSVPSEVRASQALCGVARCVAHHSASAGPLLARGSRVLFTAAYVPNVAPDSALTRCCSGTSHPARTVGVSR